MVQKMYALKTGISFTTFQLFALFPETQAMLISPTK